MPAAAARASLGKVSPASPRMSENTPLLSVDLPAELRQRQSELAQLLLEHCPSDGVYGTAVDPLALIRADGPTLPARGMHKPALCIIAQGRKEVQLAEERYIYDPLHYLVVSVTLPLAGQVIDASPDAPYLCVRLDIDPAEITQLISDAGPMEVASRRGDRGLYVDRIDASLLDAVLRLIHLLDSPRDIPMLAPLILREIFYRLLRSGQGQRLHEIAIADSQAHRITRAIDWINQNYGKPLRIEQLAQVVNLSPSTLHHRFKAVTAMSPLQYQKQLRLQEARRLIFSEGLEVAAAGYRVGYESPSQFSCEYSRLFGAPPLRDLARARNTA
ncbi:TPA: AraC family transcriptional regulator CmrA [Pseudomonas aeruginosa]|nr:AraC family transcriptional regulator CmrA [Pseudomonas aeruginosa]HBO9464512.1 AraC family transcriptional regulator CmrA [Pseudomonas aeruginosa]HBO9471655.1 AraC family transcriptional regulator CmrA [Pseudomonas aeruginosa]HBO9477488.1 AraC family transcriptional regulator CmrA [Pseudomonas aeruginosa]HBO9489120.1 AraC family transcriptional regulator CmrA [Pseudomonas aeruginosa]